jgi:hypothetical protein
MTKLPFGVNAIKRELPVKSIHGHTLIVELHPGFLRYREKGKKGFLSQVDHEVAIAVGQKVAVREAGVKI